MIDTLRDGLLVLNNQVPLITTVILFIGAFYIPVSLLFSKKEQGNSFLAYILLFFFILSSLIIRLAFIRKLFLPLYFDSAEHIRIINALLAGGKANLTPTYYHIGFHVFLSLLVSILKTDSPQAVLTFGQIILAFLPVPIFFFIWQETKSSIAALFSSVLSSFTWSMPGYAVNWGKYPMLTSLFLGSTILLYAYLLNKKRERNLVHYAALVLGITVAILTHSRILIFFAIAGLSWLMAQKISRSKPSHQTIIIGFSLTYLMFSGSLIHHNALLKLTLDPYLTTQSAYATLLVLFLSPFAYKKTPSHFYFSIFLIMGLLTSLFIPLGDYLFGLKNLTLLDRPFVETVLYIPLSIIGGLGFAQIIESANFTKSLNKNLFFLSLIGIFTLYSLRHYAFTPSSCCNFTSHDDVTAIAWIRNNIPATARILIAAEPLTVMPSENLGDLTGTDAGVWVSSLTKQETVKILYSANFEDQTTHDFLCQQGMDYIYAGNQSLSFNKSLHHSGNWYREVLSLPKVRLFALQDCSEER